MSKILLVEDDDTLAMGLKYSLENEGYVTDRGKNFVQGRELAEKNAYDLVILDIGLPDGNGFDLCKIIRKHTKTPIIFLTAQDEEVNIVMGLDMGGDDYITKPFRIKELISRIKAVLRRTVKPSQGKILLSGDIKLYPLEAKVLYQDQPLSLTPLEYRLLRFFMEHPHQVLSRNQILEMLWDIEGNFAEDNALSVYIKRLREKIEKDSSHPEYIKTLRGVGYMWNGEVRGE